MKRVNVIILSVVILITTCIGTLLLTNNVWSYSESTSVLQDMGEISIVGNRTFMYKYHESLTPIEMESLTLLSNVYDNIIVTQIIE